MALKRHKIGQRPRCAGHSARRKNACPGVNHGLSGLLNAKGQTQAKTVNTAAGNIKRVS